MNAPRWVAVAVLGTAFGAAAQTTIHRCGDGRVFSQAPCAGGEAFVVDARVDPGARDAAVRVAQREAALAERLTRERRVREAEAFHARPAAGFRTSVTVGGTRADEALEPRREVRRESSRDVRRVKGPKPAATKRPRAEPRD